MSDPVIDACRWHVDAETRRYKQRAFEHFRDRYTVLLTFLRAEGLLANPTLGEDVTDWDLFELRELHLTAEGNALVSLCVGTWNPAFGQGQTQRHLVQWRRKLARLRGTRGPDPAG